MFERIEQNLPQFDLISADLAEINRYMQSAAGQTHFAMRSWTRIVDLSIFETPYFDEREALQAAEKLMRNLMVFNFLPVQALKLQDHYKRAIEGRKDYLKYALTKQKHRLNEQIKGIPEMAELEKTLRNVRRGIERATKDLEDADSFDANMVSFQFKLPHHQRAVRVVDSRTGQVSIDYDKAADIVSKFLMEVQNRIDKVYGHLLDLEDAEFVLERKLTRRRLVDHFLQTTLRDLEALSQKSVDMKISRAVSAEESGGEINNDRKRLVTTEQAEIATQNSGPVSAKTEKFDSLKMTISKIKRAIEVSSGGQKLRILIPPESKLRERFEPQWRNVLSSMGFDGVVEFVTYENLRATPDTETPIIVYKGMNTHGNLWNRARFSNTVVVDFTPALILNSLDKI